MFVTLLVEFFDVVGVLGVIAACTSCDGVGVKLASSLQCLNLRGADVSTRSTSEPEDSLSHSEHCLQITFENLTRQLKFNYVFIHTIPSVLFFSAFAPKADLNKIDDNVNGMCRI